MPTCVVWLTHETQNTPANALGATKNISREAVPLTPKSALAVALLSIL
jgi:hypothetical protein